ncbi:hypothetical protein [Paludibacterium purpuratum]|uniref:Uncharacterized protein n=1 Tax=Paludibacterium purpuratum TaxID=1144873 RepID=A0A4R7B3U5_9NEIS|nr:hypothetical protein [Paludibacterium purpuratum]TDR76703.1 hypothetical protein DFP86_110131 [Paludibacterium purpuratum]
MIGRLYTAQPVVHAARTLAGAPPRPVNHAGRQIAIIAPSTPAASLIGDRPTPPPRPSLSKLLTGHVPNQHPLQGDKPLVPPRTQFGTAIYAIPQRPPRQKQRLAVPAADQPPKLAVPVRKAPPPPPPLGATPPLPTNTAAQQARVAFLATLTQQPHVAQRVAQQMRGFAEQLPHATDQARDGLFRTPASSAAIVAMYRDQAQAKPKQALDLKQTSDMIKTVVSPLKLWDTQVIGKSAEEVYRIQCRLLAGLPNKAGREAVVSAFKAWATAYEQAPADLTRQGFNKASVAMHGFIFEPTNFSPNNRLPDLDALLALWRKHTVS